MTSESDVAMPRAGCCLCAAKERQPPVNLAENADSNGAHNLEEYFMVSIRSGLVAGFVATFVTSALILMKNATGKLPDVHILKTWSALLGEPTHAAVGWLAHIVVGVVVGGIAFALLSQRLPTRSFAIKGVIFGILMWLVMMFVVMPLAGAGVFATHQSGLAPVATLALYVIYGLVLGNFYRSGLDDPATPGKPSAQ